LNCAIFELITVPGPVPPTVNSIPFRRVLEPFVYMKIWYVAAFSNVMGPES